MRTVLRVAALTLAVIVMIAAVVKFTVAKPPSCPNHDYPVKTEDDSFSVVPLAGAITDIPEFHDCQRLLVLNPRTKGMSYGPLVGIWVSDSLGTRLTELAMLNTGSVPMALAFAELFSWDGNYGPLGIRKRWNCLYLYPSPDTLGLRAKMVQVRDFNACGSPQMVRALIGDTVTDLYVRRDPRGGSQSSDFPPVGRWDWDAMGSRQYIGLKCGAAWCEVATTPHFQSSPRYSAPPGMAATGGRPVYAVKGWYDEQMLAVREPSWLPDWLSWLAPVRPGGFTGTIVPDPGLDGMDRARFDGWVRAGEVVVSQASPKYTASNFGPGALMSGASPRKVATVFLCHGDSCGNPIACHWKDPSDKWWARVEYEGRVKYRCVNRVDHSGGDRPIPGAARWFWEANDEKGWYGCAAGCCTTQ
jgi:hypothetical protein